MQRFCLLSYHLLQIFLIPRDQQLNKLVALTIEGVDWQEIVFKSGVTKVLVVTASGRSSLVRVLRKHVIMHTWVVTMATPPSARLILTRFGLQSAHLSNADVSTDIAPQSQITNGVSFLGLIHLPSMQTHISLKLLGQFYLKWYVPRYHRPQVLYTVFPEDLARDSCSVMNSLRRIAQS